MIYCYQIAGSNTIYAKDSPKETPGALYKLSEWRSNTASDSCQFQTKAGGTLEKDSVLHVPLERLIQVRWPKWARCPKGFANQNK